MLGRVLAKVAVALLSSSVVACSWLTRLDDLVPTEASSDAGNSFDALEAPDVFVDSPVCAADTKNDPNNCGTCGHDCCGGACTDGICQPRVLASQQSDPSFLIADDSYVYWLIDSRTLGPQPFPPSVTLIRRADLGKGSISDFATNRPIIRSSGVQTDGTSIFWTEFNLSAKPPFQIVQAKKSSFVTDAGATLQSFPLFDPNAMAGSFNGYIVGQQWAYWFAAGAPECNSGNFATCLYRAPISDLSMRQIVFPKGLPANGALAVDSAYLYFGTQTGIDRLGTTGDAGIEPISDSLKKSAGLAVSPARVFWTEPAAGAIASAPKDPTLDAGARVVLADQQNGPGGLEFFGPDVYWENQDGIVQCPQAGCPASGPATVVKAVGVTSFAITNKCIYYTSRDAQSVNVVGR